MGMNMTMMILASITWSRILIRSRTQSPGQGPGLRQQRGGLGAVGQVVAEVARPTQPGTTVDVTVEVTTMGERTVRTGAQIWERGRPQTDLS